MKTSFYVRHGKRWLDAGASLFGLIALSPLLLILAIAVRLDSEGPTFFRQERTGLGGKAFRIIKFRSMRAASTSGAPLITAAGDSRVTRVGRLLRRTKLDEIPQLFNVLVGDMSLVGPRPEVPRYTRLYTEEQRGVLLVRPGITSSAALACVKEEEMLAQQQDREAYYVSVLMPAKLQLDLAYCERVSLPLDLSLIARTLLRVPGRDKLVVPESTRVPNNVQEPA